MDNKSPTRPRYWHCIIGPIPDNQIPFGGDAPPRMAVKEVIHRMANGCDVDCSSGWIEEDEMLAIQRASQKAFTDSLQKHHG